MSSRNSFTSNYIYHKEATEELADRLKDIGYGIKASGSENGPFQVVGMTKSIEFKYKYQAEIKEILLEIQDEYDIGFDITLVFVSDDYNGVTIISTSDSNFRML